MPYRFTVTFFDVFGGDCSLSCTFLCISEQAAPLSTSDLILCLLILIIQEFGLPVKLIEKIIIASLSFPATASVCKELSSFPALDFLGVALDSDILRGHDRSI